MKNLILTICLSVAVSLSFAQIDVVGPDGDVGLGISNPERKAHVRGASAIMRIDRDGNSPGFMLAQYTSGFGTCINSYFVGASVRSGKKVFEINDLNGAVGGAGTRALLIDQNGSLIVSNSTTDTSYKLRVDGSAFKSSGGSSWSVPSDKRLKSNIQEFSSGLDLILKMNPITYDYNGLAGTKKGETHQGVIAQELQKVAPWMVSEFTYTAEHGLAAIDGEPDVHAEEGEYLSVNTSSLQWVMVNAIKEQQQLIKTQSEAIEKLQKTVNDLVSEKSTSTLNSSQVVLLEGVNDKAILSQNTPNPLKDETRISYYLPENISSASMNIRDLNGKLIKSVSLNETGNSNVILKVNGIASGLYTYSLEADGNTIDTKKMIIE